jgi:outer membrane lipoprotein SlyB
MTRLSRLIAIVPPACLVVALAACQPDYSPNVYAANAVQRANKVENGVIIGYRQVKISANGTIGAVSGGAAGGVLGAQVEGGGITTALGAVGGTLIGGIVGTTVEHVAGDTIGWEYIVRKPNGDLLSVTQREDTPLAIGQKVLVITGDQARVVADYSKPWEVPKAELDQDKDKDKDKGKEKDAGKEKATPDGTPADAKKATGDAAPTAATTPASTPDDKKPATTAVAPNSSDAAAPAGDANASAPPTPLAPAAATPAIAETPASAGAASAASPAEATPVAAAPPGDSAGKSAAQ